MAKPCVRTCALIAEADFGIAERPPLGDQDLATCTMS